MFQVDECFFNANDDGDREYGPFGLVRYDMTYEDAVEFAKAYASDRERHMAHAGYIGCNGYSIDVRKMPDPTPHAYIASFECVNGGDVSEWYIEEIDVFTVNDDGTVSIDGWTDVRVVDDDEFHGEPCRVAFTWGDWPDEFDMNYDGELVEWASTYRQYCESLHYDEALAMLKNRERKYLPLRSVSDGTRPGTYWCLIEDEPGYHRES